MANNTLFDGDAYWNDSWVQELDGDEERLYHFYITSPNLHKSGVYKQTERSVEFYVRGIGIEKIREITAKFTKAKKVIRCGEWIIMPSSLKHQNYKTLPKVVTSITEYLKKLPEEVFEALRECNYPMDLDKIRPKRQREADSLSETLPSLSETLPSLSETLPSLSETLPEYNSIQLNSIKSNSIQSELNLTQSNADKKKPPPDETPEQPQTLRAYFIDRWQHSGHGDIFNPVARIKRPKEWTAFWEKSNTTRLQVDTAFKNFTEGIRSGTIERRFMPSTPDDFVLNSWIQRCSEPYGKQKRRISNDHVDVDDMSKYFKET